MIYSDTLFSIDVHPDLSMDALKWNRDPETDTIIILNQLNVMEDDWPRFLLKFLEGDKYI